MQRTEEEKLKKLEDNLKELQMAIVAAREGPRIKEAKLESSRLSEDIKSLLVNLIRVENTKLLPNEKFKEKVKQLGKLEIQLNLKAGKASHESEGSASALENAVKNGREIVTQIKKEVDELKENEYKALEQQIAEAEELLKQPEISAEEDALAKLQQEAYEMEEIVRKLNSPQIAKKELTYSPGMFEQPTKEKQVVTEEGKGNKVVIGDAPKNK